jgi:exodeoxyribonuclease V alpha subunit
MTVTLENVKVKKVIYYSQKTQWGVLSVLTTADSNKLDEANAKLLLNDKKEIIVTGNFEGVYDGCILTLCGVPADHPKYGTQLQLQHYRIQEDISSKESIVNFLTKSTISGIQKNLALKIYREFKENSIHVVLHETNKLLNIRGIGKKTYEVIKKSVAQYFEMEELLNYCAEIGLNKFSLTMQLYKEFGKDAVKLLKENPYQLLVKSEAITFNQVDEIALKTGIALDDDNRLKYGLLYILNRESILQGSTGCADTQLKQLFLKGLRLTNSQLYRYTITKLSDEGAIYRDLDNVYLKSFYEAERNIAKVLNLLNQSEIHKEWDEKIIEEELHNFDFTLNDEQVNAIYSCLNHHFNVITSLAGCGKSTISKAIIRILKRHNLDVVLLAPTAKAAKRLKECTGYSASTIHKFLQVRDNSLEPAKNVSVPRNATILIDEASMLDVRLFEKVLDITQIDTRIILVGDTHQLPSVQAGNLLEDIIDSKKFNVCYLTDITRQADGSNIIKYSNRLNDGEPIPCTLKSDDLVCMSIAPNQKEQALKSLAHSYMKNVEKYGLLNVQVITAYKQGMLGVNNVNKVLKSIANKPSDVSNMLEDGEEIFPFQVGDKVRHTLNDYDLNVFNGETGVVVDIKKATDEDNEEDRDLLVVDFGDRYVSYDKFTVNELTLSYIATVHSSQGSEYDVVYVLLDNEVSNLLLVRKIVYTAITRAKKKCYILSVNGCVNVAISNNHYKQRLTKLKDFIENPILTKNPNDLMEEAIEEIPF